jgi:hypothetical protein
LVVRSESNTRHPACALLRRGGIAGIMHHSRQEIPMSTAVYTATVLTSARAASGMTSRARRPGRHVAG